MQFVRYRNGYEDRDLGRINAQHEFLKAVADKLLANSSDHFKIT